MAIDLAPTSVNVLSLRLRLRRFGLKAKAPARAVTPAWLMPFCGIDTSSSEPITCRADICHSTARLHRDTCHSTARLHRDTCHSAVRLHRDTCHSAVRRTHGDTCHSAVRRTHGDTCHSTVTLHSETRLHTVTHVTQLSLNCQTYTVKIITGKLENSPIHTIAAETRRSTDFGV